jgi:hypothetical protein
VYIQGSNETYFTLLLTFSNVVAASPFFKELEKTASFGFPSHGIYAILLSVYDTSIKEENI